MKLKLYLLAGAVLFTVIFTYFSYTVAKEKWQKIDFDTTVKLQDHISRRFDQIFSYFSLLGSVEVTVAIAIVLSALFLLKKRLLAALAWLLIFPASAGELFGKLVLYHPAPPVFLHRSLLPTDLPSFYIHTDFSYPSGHMTRTVFLVTALGLMVAFSGHGRLFKLITLLGLVTFGLLMLLTRVYLGEHWLSDVVGGGLLGLATGLLAAIFIIKTHKLRI